MNKFILAKLHAIGLRRGEPDKPPKTIKIVMWETSQWFIGWLTLARTKSKE
jgi:hypothetical protein